MQELEKIREEIDIKIAGSMGKKREGLLEAREIIRKHMNDGWIPVQDKLPEDDVDVLITYADIDDENYNRVHLNFKNGKVHPFLYTLLLNKVLVSEIGRAHV